MTEREKVSCRICNKKFHHVTQHLRLKHGISKEQYIQQFPDAPLGSEYFKHCKGKVHDTSKIKESQNRQSVRQRTSRTRFLNNIDKLYEEFQVQREKNVIDWRNGLNFRTKCDFDAEFCKYLELKHIKYVYYFQRDGIFRRTTSERKKYKLFRHVILLCSDLGKLKRGTFIDLKWNNIVDNDIEFKKNIVKKKPYIKIKTIYFESELWQKIRNKYPEIQVVAQKDNINVDKYTNTNRVRVKDKKILLTDDEKVKCQICGKKFYIITATHLRQHNLTTKEYAEQFPNALLKSVVLGRIHSNKIGGKNHFNYGKHLDTDTKQKISDGVTDHIKNNGIQEPKSSKRGISGYRSDIGLYVRSRLEANFIRILQYNNIDFEYEPHRFSVSDNTNKIVVPDILLKNDFLDFAAGTYIELKSKTTKKLIEVYDNTSRHNNIVINVLSSKSILWKDLVSQYQHILCDWEQ